MGGLIIRSASLAGPEQSPSYWRASCVYWNAMYTPMVHRPYSKLMFSQLELQKSKRTHSGRWICVFKCPRASRLAHLLAHALLRWNLQIFRCLWIFPIILLLYKPLDIYRAYPSVQAFPKMHNTLFAWKYTWVHKSYTFQCVPERTACY